MESQYSADVSNTVATALMPRRLGIMGGTFNPVHNAHLAMAYIAMNEFALEGVMFIPTGIPPHKDRAEVASAEHRYEMLVQACDDMRFSVSRMEIEREGFTYTVDTLRELRTRYPADTELFYIVGSDTLHDIPMWRDARQVVGLCTFIVFNRKDLEKSKLEQYVKTVQDMGGSVLVSAYEIPDISSTPIRDMAVAGEPLDAYVPPAVADYIKLNKVYG